MPINFGILQPTPPASVQVISNPAAQQNQQNLLSGINGLNAGVQEGRQNQIAQQELQLKQNEDARAAQLQPGLLSQQQAELSTAKAQQGLLGAQTAETGSRTAGNLIDNQSKQMDLAARQYSVALQQKTAAAYKEGEAKGGTEAGLDAIQETRLQNGDVSGYQTMVKAREDLKEQITKNNVAGITAIGDMVHGTMANAKPPIPPTPAAKDANGNIVPASPGSPGITALDNYTAQYPLIKKAYPDAPTPDSFGGDDLKYQDTFVHPVLATAGPIKQQLATQQEALKTDAMYKANIDVQSTIADLKAKTAQFGPKSQEAQNAAIAVQNAQKNAALTASGNSFISSIGRGIKEILPEALGGTPSTDTLIKSAMPTTPSAAQSNISAPVTPATPGSATAAVQASSPQPASAVPMAVPVGRVAVRAPDGTIGHIPQTQLQDALKSGYSPVQGQ